MRICPSCHKLLPPDVPLGLCPECLIKSGFPTGTEPGSGGGASGPRFTPPTVEEIARLFPQLEILGLIGHGGMGAVFKARQPALDRPVALKVLPAAAAGDPGFAERFNREARALARLNHPNIVAVHDFGKAGELHYLVMEFVDGANLREVERAKRLAPEQALAIVPQICEALQFAHNEGIVHRDIKPENILLDKRGRVKITDFGIAKILGQTAGNVSLTGAKDVVGTPHYMAPEQVETPQLVDHRADIYSLGVVFYEMLTGELPLGKFQPPSRKVQVDVRLDEVVLHALEKEPERRYQHASEVKTDVETIATSVPGPPPEEVAAWENRAPGWRIRCLKCGFTEHWGKYGIRLGAVGKEYTFGRCSKCGRLRRHVIEKGPVQNPPAKSEVTDKKRERVQQRLRLPATGLLAVGCLDLIITFVLFAKSMAGVGMGSIVRTTAAQGSTILDQVLSPLAIAAMVFLALVIAVGAVQMRRLKAYRLAITASILAIVLAPGSVVGLVFGIWALVALNRSEVREAFSDANRSRFSQGVTKDCESISKWVVAARWTARILGTALLLFYSVFIIAEGLPPIASQPGGVQLNFVALGLMLGGFIVGWKREGTAALLIVSGWTLWQISEGAVRWNLFQTPLPVAALYAWCWWMKQGRKAAVAVAAGGSLAVAFVLGRLFLPVNVFIRGAVRDAATGAAITNATLTLLPAPRNPSESRPNARTDTNGRFRLYVGWYAPEKALSLSAPGCSTLKTNLGPRPTATRALRRDFLLQRESRFGVVVERVLYSIVTERPIKGEEMDTGREITVPGDVEKAGEVRFFHWIAKAGVDLMAWSHSRFWTLWVSPKLVSAEASVWDKPEPADLRAALRTGQTDLMRSESDSMEGFASYTFETNTAFPKTYVFETKSGNQGVLQLTGLADNPRGVKIRYKLVSPATNYKVIELNGLPLRDAIQSFAKPLKRNVVFDRALEPDDGGPCAKSVLDTPVTLCWVDDRSRVGVVSNSKKTFPRNRWPDSLPCRQTQSQ